MMANGQVTMMRASVTQAKFEGTSISDSHAWAETSGSGLCNSISEVQIDGTDVSAAPTLTARA